MASFLSRTIRMQEHRRTSTMRLRESYMRRAYRIFPAAFFFMAVAFITYWHEFRWYNVLAGILYLANFDLSRPWIFGHLWSLGVEEQFYLIWPSILKRWYEHRLWIVLTVFLVV